MVPERGQKDFLPLFYPGGARPLAYHPDLPWIRRFPPGQFYLWGESQGGFVAAMGAARLKEQVKGLILLYPALLYQEVCRDLFPSKEAVTDSVRWEVPLGSGR